MVASILTAASVTPMAQSLRSAIISSPLKWAIGPWALFIFENAVLSENRTSLISFFEDSDVADEEIRKASGDSRYHVFYGLCSTSACASILYGYRYKVRNAAPYFPKGVIVGGPRGRAFAIVLQAAGLALFSQTLPKFQIPVEYQNDPTAFSTERGTDKWAEETEKPPALKFSIRCPFDFADSTKISGDEDMPSGVDRITRHPGLWSMAMFSAGHAFTVSTLSIPQFSFFLMPVAVALFGGAHTDSRFRRGMGGTLGVKYDERTSNVPFFGLLKQSMDSPAPLFNKLVDETKVLNAAIAIGSAFSLALLRRPLASNTAVRMAVKNVAPA